MIRCTRCVLPENYVNITFDDLGVCNHCTAQEEYQYLGSDALARTVGSFLVQSKQGSRKHDCVLLLSGGRDSSYLAYYAVKVLNLKVLACFFDHGLIPEQTRQNITNAVESLGVDLVVEPNSALRRCLGHTYACWTGHPSLGMVETLCTGCRLGIWGGMIEFARERHIPLVLMGDTRLERASFKHDLMKPGRRGGRPSAVAGYVLRLARNPRWIMDAAYVPTQVREYLYFFHWKQLSRKAGVLVLNPFLTHIEWQEREVLSTIERELGWKVSSDYASTFRGDCDLALIKSHIYRQVLGYDEKDCQLAALIRANQITREEGLRRLHEEVAVPEDLVKEVLAQLGLDYRLYRRALDQLIAEESRTGTR